MIRTVVNFRRNQHNVVSQNSSNCKAFNLYCKKKNLSLGRQCNDILAILILFFVFVHFIEFLLKSSDDDARKECRKCLQFVLRAYRMSPYG